MKGKFRIKGIKSTNPIAVEMYELEESSDTVTGTIPNIHEDRSKSVNLSHQMHIASNIDRVFY
jgi:ribosome biogenesis GTPase